MIPGRSRSNLYFIAALLLFLGCFIPVQVAIAQENMSMDTINKSADSAQSDKTKAANPDQKADSADQQATDQEDPLKRTRPETKGSKVEKLGGVYKKWLDEDVRWIITGEELSAFKKLSNNAERDQFIENFWLRRDPTPDTAENE
ncbi:MAG TPA: GWxTD domain-containing protein, partial [Verrucomicrobiae bacterium]|nr:GWxTD domain-containing protein [Verrucomicrobiae bacterium]